MGRGIATEGSAAPPRIDASAEVGLPMLLISLSTDEVNRSLVRGWGLRRGLRVACPRHLDHAVAAPGDAVVLDLDHLPSGSLDGTIARLGAGPRLAVHGHGADEAEWQPRGLEVRSHLGPAFLRRLVASPNPSAASAAEERHPARLGVA